MNVVSLTASIIYSQYFDLLISQISQAVSHMDAVKGQWKGYGDSISAPRHPWLTSHLIFFLCFSGNRAAGKRCSMLGSAEHRAYGLVGTSRSCCCMQLFPFLLYSIAKGSVAGGEMRFPLYLLQISNKYFVSMVLLYQCQSQKKSLGEKDGGERKGS